MGNRRPYPTLGGKKTRLGTVFTYCSGLNDVKVFSAMPSKVDLRDYPHGNALHGQSLNWIYANGLDPFAIPHGEVEIVGDHLTAQVTDGTWRTLPMQTPPEEYGLTRRG